MNTNAFPSRAPRRQQEDGIAIILVLAFLVLLTGLVFAFFSRAVTERQVANSSLNVSKADIFARSAVDVILGDFKQEIVDGSASPAPTPAAGVTLYVPKSPANMLPQTSGTPAPIPNPSPSPPTLPIPNLVRRSVRNDPLAKATPAAPAFKAVTTSASTVNSTTDPSTNNRSVTLARWNSHYLIPRHDTGTTIDSTPISPLPAPFGPSPAPDANGFIPPDWVMVTTSGPKVLTAPDMTTVGRYAYAIYDEGGLLDINAVGYPSLTDPVQSASKRSLAYADLSQLPYPIPRTPADGASQVDQIVGWRNYATTQPGGTFGNYKIDAPAAKRYSDFLLDMSSGFLTVNAKPFPSPATPASRTDQMFTSRQALLSYRRGKGVGFSQNALQYLGTFSRALEQPSFIPAHIQYPGGAGTKEAPNINSVSSTPPPLANAVDTYKGNNDAAGKVGSTAAQDLINPSLLTVRVTDPFTRADVNKTAAIAGEPLLKRKFALSRLAEVSFDATSTTKSITDPTANSNHIRDWFGLSRTDPSAAWTYDHGGTASGGGVRIMKLSDVVAAKREPDLAELLKAAINIGSLAKGGPNLKKDEGNYQYTLDVAVDYQVLQIMANLIDQSDVDSFPTVIQMGAGSGVMRTFRGSEDLPYFYRYHPFSVVTEQPAPLLDTTKKVSFIVGYDTKKTPPEPDTRVLAPCMPAPASGLQNPGKAVMLYIPEVWNPNDASAPALTVGRRPEKFRLTVVTNDPLGQPSGVWQTGMKPKMNSDWYSYIPPVSALPKPSAPLPLAEGTTSFTFSDDKGKLFREPTLLWRADAPTGSGLAAETGSLAGPYTDVNTGAQYLGVQIGQGPISSIGYVDGAAFPATPKSPDDTYLFQASAAEAVYTKSSGAYAQYTFRLQYQDPNNPAKWITYDEKYPDIHGLYRSTLIVNKADFPRSQWANPLPNRTNQMSDSATGYDPRTARFGIGTASEFNENMMPLEKSTKPENSAADNYNADSDVGNMAMTNSKFTVLVSQRPFASLGSKVKYSTPGMSSDENGGQSLEQRWFSGRGFNAAANISGADGWPLLYDGVMFGQNNPAINVPSRKNPSLYPAQHLYYEDPDGIARRAMGAYADTSLGTATGANVVGMPHATANSYNDNGAGKLGVGTPLAQNLSRPLILNRPFRNVAEMAYTFRGTPWKQIDFFTPESGDTALLDVFCVSEPPSDAKVAGKVNLNTRQYPVLQAIVAGAMRDELKSAPTAPDYALPELSKAEAENVAKKLVEITTDSTHKWRGPLANLSDLVGRYVDAPGDTAGFTDFYTFNETVTSQSYTYAGLSAALDGTVYSSADPNHRIQRTREAAIRALAANGQTRVWNLMIDLVAQTGRYGLNATALNQFIVDGEKRYWVHVAIDRYTGEIIDKQIEAVTE